MRSAKTIEKLTCIEKKLCELIASSNSDVKVVTVCNTTTNLIEYHSISHIAGVPQAPVITATAIECDNQKDYEFKSVCDSVTNTVHAITFYLDDTETEVIVSDVDTGEACGSEELCHTGTFTESILNPNSIINRKDYFAVPATTSAQVDADNGLNNTDSIDAVIDAFDFSVTPDLESTQTSLAIPDAVGGNNTLPNITVLEGYVNASVDSYIQFTTTNQASIKVFLASGCNSKLVAVDTTARGSGGVASGRTSAILIPAGVSNIRVVAYDYDGANGNWSVRSSLTPNNFSAGLIPEITFGNEEPENRCFIGKQCEGSTDIIELATGNIVANACLSCGDSYEESNEDLANKISESLKDKPTSICKTVEGKEGSVLTVLQQPSVDPNQVINGYFGTTLMASTNYHASIDADAVGTQDITWTPNAVGDNILIYVVSTLQDANGDEVTNRIAKAQFRFTCLADESISVSAEARGTIPLANADTEVYNRNYNSFVNSGFGFPSPNLIFDAGIASVDYPTLTATLQLDGTYLTSDGDTLTHEEAIADGWGPCPDSIETVIIDPVYVNHIAYCIADPNDPNGTLKAFKMYKSDGTFGERMMLTDIDPDAVGCC